jgi:hypothetical protein
LRRLLVFGTGAAVIGTLLLITAFYETYVIVNHLQSSLNTAISATSNNLLEDSSIEAIFLGIMAALGYVLIAQGLEGIRKQELVDMQRGTTRGSVGQPRSRVPSAPAQGERPRGWRSVLSPQGGIAQESATTADELSIPPKAEPQKKFSFSSQAQAPVPAQTTADRLANVSTSSPENDAEAVQSTPVSVTPGEPDVTERVESHDFEVKQEVSADDEPSITRGEETTPWYTPSAETPSAPEQRPSSDESPSITTSGESGVTWEGGAPAPLEGVEVLPEPRTYEPATYGSPMGSSFTSTQTTPPTESIQVVTGQEPSPDQEIPAQKRRRGRPKGTKKKQPDQPETPAPSV